MVSGELLHTVVFNTSITSVTMDVSEYRLFAGGSNGDIFAVNMYGQVCYIPREGYSHFFCIHRFGPSICPSPPKNIRNFKHPKNIFEILATQKNIPYSVP